MKGMPMIKNIESASSSAKDDFSMTEVGHDRLWGQNEIS